tara:strand:+ start:289 stop:1428 length:1140 start_codon:yes stop_codon:yes gene_type:complete
MKNQLNTNNHTLDFKTKISLSIILPSFNEKNNIQPLINDLLSLSDIYELEIIVVDDSSTDGTSLLIRRLAQADRRVRLISRVGRSGLSSAIKEGCLCASGDILAIMDSDGQHEVNTISNGIEKLIRNHFDFVIGSRFLEKSAIRGLSEARKEGSNIANLLAKISLANEYSHITDFMSGCMVLDRQSCISFIEKIDVNGFKFLYELLAVSKGQLKGIEIELTFQPRKYGTSKLDIAIVWDFLVSLVHTFFHRVIPRKAISFAFVGAIGVIVQFCMVYFLILFVGIGFEQSLPFAIITSASSNYLINNSLTFRSNRLKNRALIIGLFKFLIVSSLPIVANIGLATSFFNYISPNIIFSQLAGIIVVYIWNYAASSRLVWNN